MTRKLLAAALAAWTLGTASSLAEEMTVQNDSFQSGGSTVIVAGFIPGEEAAVRLTSPCDGTIVAIQVGWLASPPGAQPSIERQIHVEDGSTFPVPAGPLSQDELLAPALTPGALNEFRFLDDQMTLPISIPVSENEEVFVSLEFENPATLASGSVIRDVDGCTSNRNAILAIPGGWFDLCLITSGDFIIRMVVDCATSDPTGACCFETTGGCLDETQSDCALFGGVWQGPASDCAGTVCFPEGACCLPDGSCMDNMSPEDCLAVAGVFQGDGTDCGTTSCPEPTGACCTSAGACLERTEAQCNIAGGTWLGIGSDCEDADMNGTADDCESPPCPGDANGDNVVDLNDLAILLGSFGASVPAGTGADFNGNGVIDLSDLAVLLSVFGSSC